jgi:hypothetical protein
LYVPLQASPGRKGSNRIDRAITKAAEQGKIQLPTETYQRSLREDE